MPETPERKVLKEMLVKLKTKVFDCQKMFFELSISMSTTMTENLSESLENVMKMPEGEAKTTSLFMLTLFHTWNQHLNLLNTTISALIGDMNLYIETLERYSVELDSTLTDIFERAKKMHEEELKKQEELRKRKPSTMIA